MLLSSRWMVIGEWWKVNQQWWNCSYKQYIHKRWCCTNRQNYAGTCQVWRAITLAESSRTWLRRRSGAQKKSTKTCLSLPTSWGWCFTICNHKPHQTHHIQDHIQHNIERTSCRNLVHIHGLLLINSSHVHTVNLKPVQHQNAFVIIAMRTLPS